MNAQEKNEAHEDTGTSRLEMGSAGFLYRIGEGSLHS